MNRPALVFTAAGIAVLAALFLLLRPEQAPPSVAEAPAVPAAPPPAEFPAGPDAPSVVPLPMPVAMTVEWTVRGGKRVDGPALVVLKAGDEVELRINSDRDDELHLHGYDLSMPLRAGQTATLRFHAEHSGRFDCELHHSHLELATLEVRPE
ncbi:hypothetical protein [Solimonas sp. K1W22B-7]|uniref:hypothetical protein n=1 Tax=Solimonas sp. K1W22B-7 TaxID=2303331 RepID=UPI0013C43952|nr:hypothetical protein [Solimonas sp. K1W22B-7]